MKRLHWVDYGLVIGFLALAGALTAASPVFLTWSNLMNVARQVSINGLLAAGETFVVLSAGIDISVGSTMALAGAVVAGVGLAHGFALGGLAALLVGTAVGLANGLFVVRFRVPAFIATLAMLGIARGATLIYTQGRPISGLPESFLFIGNGWLGPVPFPVVLMLATYAAAHVTLRYTAFGRYVYAVGGNARAARYAGIHTEKVLYAVYAIAGFLAAVGGIVLTSRLASADPQAGVGIELDAIAAVVLGGASLFGGEGSVLRTLLGALILGVLNNGMNLLNVSPFYQEVIKGAVILFAVVVGNWRPRSQGQFKTGG
ncbi:MAG: ABC transporter permease [Firmicutes bacterium]|nr:ABC transporter permease [Bacillota bacterium]